MYTKQPKKLTIMNILDILKRYTDENHRLSQKEIQDILEREYDMKVERKAVKRNLMNLIEFGYNINCSESVRIFKDKDGKEQENVILSDFYLEREFTDSELRLLIDSVLFSNHIPYKQDKELVDKLASLSNIYFKKRVNHIARMPEDKTDNKQLFYNVELLDEAIEKSRKVRFHYLEYRSDKRLHKRRCSDGKVREYIINPYQLVAKEGKYYLICNYDKYDDISNYRVDRITDLEILDENIKPFDRLKGSDGRNPLYNDDIIYSPEVCVIKKDNAKAEMLAEEDWYKVNVISCAAPNLRKVPSNAMNPGSGDKAAVISVDELRKLHEQRIRRIFEVAAENGNEVLIAGAFGCGAFKNPPEVVAEAFHSVVIKLGNRFETIEFAVACGKMPSHNFLTFQKVFDKGFTN